MNTYPLSDLAALVGTELGTSGWLAVEQGRIDLFADATGDHQWIHTDPERAAAGPFGSTIAHGYLTLSLLPVLVSDAFALEGVSRRVNYGLDKVRFPAPVKVGSKVRATVTLVSYDAGRMKLRVVVELEGGERPACVAETLTALFT
ncbi:MaoC family dehydratase [Nocardioides carbamazepini]|uniref:MaoC family dehydratase n=1 Tax=Nocardioides carbamazepini TaxID=2854259 RepID=UPI00214A64CF|nr:MaoC family dehydratase [Nocardioides carbamazepini]MCR1783688.1 MaoC family dehydratase [Nocardioides carbamazepini]